MFKKLFFLLVCTSSALTSVNAYALIFTNDLLFENSNQSMWSEGSAAEWSVETFLGKKWGTYSGGSAVDKSIGIDVGVASVRGGIKSSGEIGIIPWAEASGGSIDISLPALATVTLPDTIRTNSYFTVSTSSSIQSTAKFVAEAPNFKAGIDGLFNMDNRLYGEAATFVGCGFLGTKSCEWNGGVDVSLNPGRFSLLGFDTTEDKPLRVFDIGVPDTEFDTQYLIHVPAGPAYPFIYDADKGTTTPPPTPIVGNLILHNLENISGGVVSDNQLSLTTNQGIFEAKLSITGVLETLIGSPGVLRKEITVFENKIKDINAGYVLADVSTGPIFGMQQSFQLDPNLAVRLEFDKPVTRLEWLQTGTHTESQDINFCYPWPTSTCIKIGAKEVEVADYDWVPVAYDDGLIEILIGEDAELLFGDGFASLLSLEYFLDDPIFNNQTYATIDPALQIQALCANFTGLGQKCVYDETFHTEGLATMKVYSNDWMMAGFNSTSFDMLGKGPTEAVPEPATMLFFCSGLAGLASYRRKQKKVT